ncbi:hypothetical protein J8V44_08475 [Photorhabdus bodei]|nr:hypothetical protein [Photorhabdus bodei]
MTGVSECSQQRGNLKDDGYIFFHNLTRPSSTISSRSVKKPELAFSCCKKEFQQDLTGRRIMISSSRIISNSFTPSKSRSRGISAI